MRPQSVGQNGHAPEPVVRPLTESAPSILPWRMRCPICHASLGDAGAEYLVCDGEGHAFSRIDGIWRCLPEQRSSIFERFVQEYETVRQFEGRSGNGASYYRALPFEDQTGQFAADWRIRASSFRALIERVVKPLEARHGQPLHVLDLGAGNCWLSNRLAERGHTVAAIDLLTNAADGLGAHRHYQSAFTPIQAEFDRLPLESGQSDLAIFNGSIHYSTDFNATLLEARRILRPDGLIVILDSPVYHDPESGKAMVRERESRFEKEVGFPSNALPMENYWTFGRLEEISRQIGIRWSIYQPFYGVRWSVKPWAARLRGRREPAKFLLISGSGTAGHPPFDWTFRRRVTRSALRVSRRWKVRKQRQIVLEQIGDYHIVVLPAVFNPRLLRSGEFFASQLTAKTVPANSRVLDLGTGSGIAAITAARWAKEVVAVDINPVAVRCATINTFMNGVEVKVDVRQGDLFEPVANERFDLILLNPPFYRGTPRHLLDFAWRSDDMIWRFAREMARHLTPDGSALVILSTDGEEEQFLADFRASGLDVRAISWRDYTNEMFTVYRLTDPARTVHDHSV